MQEAKSFFKEAHLERSFDFFTRTINIMLQVSGPLHRDVASCISKLANIQFKIGDFNQAIELQNKSIILHERLLGYDHPQVAYSYSNLALFYHTCGSPARAIEYMFKALNILKVVCG